MRKSDTAEGKAKLLMAVSMVIYGTIGIFRKYIPLPSGMLAMSRGIIGALFLLVFLWCRRERLHRQGIKRNLFFLCLSGGMLGMGWILFFEAYQHTTVAKATLFYYTAPIILLLVSPFFFRERLTGKKLFCVALALLGMVFASGVLQEGFVGFSEWKGIALSLGAAVFYAAVVLCNRKITGISPYDKTIVQLAVSSVVLLPYVLAVEGVEAMTFAPMMLVALLVLGVVHTGIAYAMYFGSLEHLKAQTVALLSYIDPIVAILLAAVFLHEPMGLFDWIGAVLVLGATLLSELWDRRRSEPRQKPAE